MQEATTDMHWKLQRARVPAADLNCGKLWHPVAEKTKKYSADERDTRTDDVDDDMWIDGITRTTERA